jgi:ATP-binding cassette subfamily C protein CydCD
MPQGLDQRVGDGGWELSEGERWRVFAARALLSQRPVVILDGLLESLDPDSIHLLLAAAGRRASVLVLTAARGRDS